jgi:NitT/TauT family transport system permease protein
MRQVPMPLLTPHHLSWRPLFFWAVALLTWELVGHFFAVRPDILPTPSRIVLEAWRDGPYMAEHMWATTYAVITGLICAFAVASLAFLACTEFRQSCLAVRAVSDMWLVLPVLAVAPVLVHWFGYGGLPRTLLVALATCPVLASGIFRGMARIPAAMAELMSTLGATRAQTTLKLRIPFILPALLESMKTAVAAAVAASVVGEFVQAEAGLGFLMLSALSRMNTPLLFAGVLAAASLAGVLAGIVGAARRILVPWHRY